MKQATIQEIKEKILPILRARGVKRTSLFGSVVRGEDDSKSDVDVIVEMPEGKSLFDLVDLKAELEETLGRPVDVITFKSVHPLLRENIEREQVAIL